MPATVKIYRYTGPGLSTSDLNPSGPTGINTRANLSDTHSTNSTSNPIPIPDAGTNFSYWVTTGLWCTVAPAGTINNLRWYSDGANNLGTGVTCNVAKASTGANGGYRQATGDSNSGTELNTTNHTGLDEVPASAFGFSSGSPKTLVGSTSGTGGFGDFVVLQVAVDQTANPGVTGQETFTWRYDET